MLLALLQLAYKSCMRLPTPSEAENHWELSWQRFERLSETHCGGYSDVALECNSVLGCILFLRLLTKNLELCDGALENVPSLLNGVPTLQHSMKQATSLTVIEKIVRATIKRHLTDGLATATSFVTQGDLVRARWKF